MLTIAFITGWVWENVPHWILALIPLAMLVADIGHFNKKWFPQRDDYQAQITRASHGAAFVLLAPLMVHFITLNHFDYYFPPQWLQFEWPAAFGLMALGLWWLVIGWARTMVNRRDMNLIVRAIVKACVGAALLYALFHAMLPEEGIPQQLRGYLNVAVLFLGLWMCITAIVRLALLMKKMRTMNSMQSQERRTTLGGFHWS
jgi:hypothetical protein